jgi:hypothetical protein
MATAEIPADGRLILASKMCHGFHTFAHHWPIRRGRVMRYLDGEDRHVP